MNTRFLISVCVCLALLMPAQSGDAREDIVVNGRVVGGKTVLPDQVDVATFWRANGTGRKLDGSALDLSNENQLGQFWGSVGQMEPFPGDKHVCCTQSGEFEIKVGWRDRVLLAMDRSKKFGGIVAIPRDYSGDELEIHLQPLTIVRAELRSTVDGKPCQWSHGYVHLEADPSRPMAINRFVSCGPALT